MPVAASYGYLNRARHELQGIATVLPRQREEDKGVSSYPDHGGLNSGEDTPMAAVAGMDNTSLPKLKWLSSEVDARKGTMVALVRWRLHDVGELCAANGAGAAAALRCACCG